MKIKQRNYMGVMVVNHYTADTAIECIGAQLPSPSITEVALYEASKSIDDGKVIRGKLLAKAHMSDHQFGMMISQPNFSYGQLVTLNHIDGYDITPIASHCDPAKDNISAEIQHFLGNNANQVACFIREMIELSESVVAKNRLSKSDKSEIKRYIPMLLSYVEANDSFSLNEINHVAEQRVNEVKSAIHHTIRDAYRIGGMPLPAMENNYQPVTTDKQLDPAGFISIHLGGSSSSNLFDDINTSNRVVSLSISSAALRRNIDVIEKDEYCSEKQLFSVEMSAEQYARFVRADKMEVACTITRRFAERMDTIEDEDTRKLTFTPSSATDTYQDYVDAVNVIQQGIDNETFKGKAGLAHLLESFNAVQAAYERYLTESTDAKLDAAQAIFNEKQQNISDFFEKEVQLLSVDVKNKVVKPLQSLVTKVNMRIDDKR